MMLRTTVTDSLSEMGQKLTNFRLICEVTEFLMESSLLNSSEIITA